jgi:tetratricopeptide (TPR) repeat protein
MKGKVYNYICSMDCILTGFSTRPEKAVTMKTFSYHPFWLITAAALLLCRPAPGQGKSEKDEAKERFQKGLAFVDEGDCKKAIVEFKEAYKAYPVSVILYNMALCYDDMHRYALAMEYYKQYLDTEKKVSADQLDAIEKRISTLETFLGTLRLSCNIDGAAVTVDGNEAGETPLQEIYLETGDHKIIVEKKPYETHRETVTGVSGKTTTLDVFLEEAGSGSAAVAGTGEGSGPTAEGKRKKLRPGAFWGTLAATLALGITAGVVGGLNVANHNAFEDTDPADRDRLQDLQDKGQLYNALFLTTLSLACAAAAAAVVVGVFTDFKKEKSSESLSLAVMPAADGGLILLSMPMGGHAW